MKHIPINSHDYSAGCSASKASSDSNTAGHATMSVFEHQRLVAEDFIDVDDFVWLLAQEFTVFTIKRQRGQWQLKVGHYIGIILLPSGITLEILPKVATVTQKNSLTQNDEIMRTRQWVQMMLTDLMTISNRHHKLPHTKTLGQLSQHLMPLSTQTPPLSQWLIRQFLQLLSDYQPTKQYQTQSQNQSMLQGKLLIKEQLKHNSHQPHKFVCEVNQLSTDILANRIIKSALVFLEQLAGTSQAYQSQSMSLSAALMSKLVCWRQITELNHYERQRLSPLYQRAKQQLTFQPLSRLQRQSVDKLLDLAYWLLQMQYSALPTGNGVSHKDGQMRLCLLINMNQAFEQWASLRLTQMFEQSTSIDQPSYQTFTQQKDIWLRDATGQTCLSIQPDLLIYDTATKTNSQKQRTGKAGADASHCSHVIDIKWKTLTHARDISATDAYQLTSYAQAYQAKQVWLVYPVIDDSPQPVALQQFIDSIESNHAILWLMPFNVTTGTLNKTTLST